MTPEGKIKDKIRKWIKENGGLYLSFYNGGIPLKGGGFMPPPQKGIADIIFCYNGRFCACEVKIPGKVPRPDQIAFLEQVKEAGGIGFWTDDLLGFQKVISRIRMADRVITRLEVPIKP